MVLNKPSVTSLTEMLGHLVQFLSGHQGTLENMNSMGTIAPRMFTLLALAYKIRAWLFSLLRA